MRPEIVYDCTARTGQLTVAAAVRLSPDSRELLPAYILFLRLLEKLLQLIFIGSLRDDALRIAMGDLLNDLPSPSIQRWRAWRKAAAVAAVRSGSISLAEVCRRYNLSVEKFAAWERDQPVR